MDEGSKSVNFGTDGGTESLKATLKYIFYELAHSFHALLQVSRLAILFLFALLSMITFHSFNCKITFLPLEGFLTENACKNFGFIPLGL